ncbi:MAG: hypothetical protein K6T30_05660 [Alicyclobacillus sp.]|nr:hypothetical protein [Alicyclobacillus sp.]
MSDLRQIWASRAVTSLRPQQSFADQARQVANEPNPGAGSFSAVLREVSSGSAPAAAPAGPEACGGVPLRVSAHARQRLAERGLTFTETDWARLSEALTRAERKGARDAYLLYGDAGLVVNVPNRTVITAMETRGGQVVTQIDSVVIVPRPDPQGGLAAGTD